MSERSIYWKSEFDTRASTCRPVSRSLNTDGRLDKPPGVRRLCGLTSCTERAATVPKTSAVTSPPSSTSTGNSSSQDQFLGPLSLTVIQPGVNLS
jgi:hypothetical protein